MNNPIQQNPNAQEIFKALKGYIQSPSRKQMAHLEEVVDQNLSENAKNDMSIYLDKPKHIYIQAQVAQYLVEKYEEYKTFDKYSPDYAIQYRLMEIMWH